MAPREDDFEVTGGVELRMVPLEATLALRDRMLSPGHPGRPVVWPYDDQQAKHWGAYREDQLVGCASYCPGVMPDSPPDNAYRLHSMAVDAEAQGRGVGALMLRRIGAEVHAAGAELLFATARASALGFYLRCGMRPAGLFIVPETGFEVRYVVLDRDALGR